MHDSDLRTWNVFRRCHSRGLCCAVLAEAPVPAFLMCGEWEFGFVIADGASPAAVTGFAPVAADADASFDGFHLFLAFAPPLAQPAPQPAAPWVAPPQASPLAPSLALPAAMTVGCGRGSRTAGSRILS